MADRAQSLRDLGGAVRAWNAALLHGPFPAFALLYATLFCAYGTVSPFLPAFLAERGLSPSEIGVALAAGAGVRLVAGPAAGRIADLRDATRAVLGLAALASGILAFAYLAGYGFWPLLALSMAHALATAALAPLADTLALASAASGRFAYAWVRGIGSAAFILGTLASGQLVAATGLSSIAVSAGVLFLAMAGATLRVPDAKTPNAKSPDAKTPNAKTPNETSPRDGGVLDGFRAILAIPLFRRLTLVGGLVIGSHALSDAFAVIRWREAGLEPGMVSLLWSVSVASEVVVFLFLGEPLLRRLGPAGAGVLAALVGALRWAVMAQATAPAILAVAQLGHGISFALLHLANMRLISVVVPARLAATAQTLYGTLGLGLASAALTAASGVLYARLGAQAFWLMSGLCLLAVPLAAGMRAQKGLSATPSAASGR